MEPLNNKNPHWTATADTEVDSTKHEPGNTIGPYLLIASLDSAGDVWKAYDTRLNRTVAIRFTNGSRKFPDICHPHVCAVFETGPNYIVTEFVDGTPLAGPLPVALALEYCGQILGALETGYRGLKPCNILVTAGGIKLCSLGQSEPCKDARMDIFPFGCVLYEMLTGISVASVFDHPLPSLDGLAPPALATFVLQCLETDPGRRWQTVADLKLALGRCDRISAPAPASRRKRVWPAVASALLVASGGLAWFKHSWDASKSVTSVTELTRNIEAEFHPAMSPDGKSVAHVRESVTGNNDIWVTSLDGESRRLTDDVRSELHPSWSPDGRQIAYLRAAPGRSVIMLVPASGGESKELVDIGRFDPGHMRTRAGPLSRQPNPGPAWSPDGKEIAFRQCPGPPPEGCPLFAISTETSQIRKLTARLPRTSDFSPAWSPDGKYIAFARYSNLVNADLYVVPAGGGEPSRVTNESHSIRGVAWTPDSKAVVFASDRAGVFSLWKIALHGSTVTPVYSPADHAIDPTISKNGDVMVFTDAVLNSSVWCFDIEQQTERQLIRSARQNVNAAFSPDGKRIAFASNRLGSWQLWSTDADGAHPVQLTKLRDTGVGVIRWSPDGKQIAFEGQTSGHIQVLIVPADGGAAAILKVNLPEPRLGNWSHDGKSIYIMAPGGGRPRIWKAPTGGGSAQPVIEAIVTDLVESPDGKRLYMDANRAGGLREVELSSGQMQPVKALEEIRPDRWWTLTANHIYYYDTPEGEPTIFSYCLADHAIQRVTALGRNLPLTTPSLAVSPDGKHVIYTRADEVSSKLVTARGSFRGQ